MWIEVIVWYQQPLDSELERLGIDKPQTEKYNPEKEGAMLINTDHITDLSHAKA